MTKDIMRAAIAKDITEAKESNIKFINKMDQTIAVIQAIKYEAWLHNGCIYQKY
mgnify:CR=1 FL=1